MKARERAGERARGTMARAREPRALAERSERCAEVGEIAPAEGAVSGRVLERLSSQHRVAKRYDDGSL